VAELANDPRACHWANSSNRQYVVKRFRGGKGFVKNRGHGCIEVQPNHFAVLDAVIWTSYDRRDTPDPGTKGDRQRA
jgi:hypothetical protein